MGMFSVPVCSCIIIQYSLNFLLFGRVQMQLPVPHEREISKFDFFL